MIVQGSRYIRATVTMMEDVQTSNGSAIVPSLAVINRPSFNTNVNVRKYYVRQGDRWDTLAYQIYGSCSLWWVLADINPEIIYPDQLPAGTQIRIPII